MEDIMDEANAHRARATQLPFERGGISRAEFALTSPAWLRGTGLLSISCAETTLPKSRQVWKQ